ncbi:MAG: chemotaxis protein CheW [Alphaproteobacteria bacterium]|nr:chemotaxis protein CheW [Alphaproteobacteria bacterium]
MNHTASPPAVPGLEATAWYLTFGIDAEVFAINVVQVREVLGLCPFTRVPNTPPFVRGMISLRGKGVPVIDLRVKFGLSPTEATDKTRIIVLDMQVEGTSLIIGVLADRVYEVATLEANDTEPPPNIGVRWRSEAIRGIGRRGDAFIIILNLNRVLTSDELNVIENP